MSLNIRFGSLDQPVVLDHAVKQTTIFRQADHIHTLVDRSKLLLSSK
jgi:hypothetical protein